MSPQYLLFARMSISHKGFSLLKSTKLVFQIKPAPRGTWCVFERESVFQMRSENRESIKWKDKEMDAVRGGCAVQLGWNWETQKSLERCPLMSAFHICSFQGSCSCKWDQIFTGSGSYRCLEMVCICLVIPIFFLFLKVTSMFANVEVFVWNLAYWTHLEPQDTTERAG